MKQIFQEPWGKQIKIMKNTFKKGVSGESPLTILQRLSLDKLKAKRYIARGIAGEKLTVSKGEEHRREVFFCGG